MKRYLYAICAVAAGVMASCSQRGADPVEDGSMQEVTFRVSVEDQSDDSAGMASRGVSTAPTRYMVQAYDDTGAAYGAPANVIGGSDKATSATGVFKMVLDRKLKYRFLFWADAQGGTDAYVIGNLKDGVSLVSGKSPVESWCNTAEVVVDRQTTPAPMTLDVTLRRAVSKVVLKETGSLKAGTVLKMTLNQPTKMLIDGGADGFVKASGSVSRTESYTFAADVDGTPSSAVELIPRDKPVYVFSSLSTADVTKISFTIGTQAPFDVDNVPLRANYLTNLIGHFTALTSKDILADVEGTWQTPDFEKPLVPVVLQVGYFIYEDGSYSKEYTAPTPVSGLLGTRAATDTCVGVVFWVDPNQPNRAKVVNSWGYTWMNAYSWGGSPYVDIPGTHSRTDGKANTLAATQMADYSNVIYYRYHKIYLAKRNGGLQWYMPAIEEVIQLSDNIDAVEFAFDALGAGQTVNSRLQGADIITSTSVNATQYINMIISNKTVSNGVESIGAKYNWNNSICIAEIVY